MRAAEFQQLFFLRTCVKKYLLLLLEQIKGEFTPLEDADAQFELKVLKKNNKKKQEDQRLNATIKHPF